MWSTGSLFLNWKNDMLEILNLDEFRAMISHKEEMREADIGEDCVSFCYMVSGENTFDTASARECRGIVFNKTAGVVVGRPLHKFFNVNERAETQLDAIDWSKVVRVMDKRDGSMIHSVWTMNGIRLKSKKTFDSDVAKAAEAWMHAQPDLNVFRFIMRMQAMSKTAIFEWTAPDARIVLFYPDSELKLLHVRDNKSGEYMDLEDLRKWADEYGVKMVDEVDEFWLVPDGAQFLKREFDIHTMLDAVNTREGIEGWVIQFEDGNMVKVKTKWYLERHRAMTFLRERDIAEAVLNESIDDLKSLLVSEGVHIDEILNIEEAVVDQISGVHHWVEGVILRDGKMDRKDFALQYQKSHGEFGWFGLLMARFSGKEPDYKAWYVRHCLKEKWSLRQLNMVPSVAEGD